MLAFKCSILYSIGTNLKVLAVKNRFNVFTVIAQKQRYASLKHVDLSRASCHIVFGMKKLIFND